jgi:SAM-dependent methyltransferase
MNDRQRLYSSYVSANKTYTYAATGDRDRAQNFRFLDYFLKDWMRDLPKDAAVFDLGCGAGHFLEYLKSRGFTGGSGVDLSRDQLELARQRGLVVQEASLFDALADPAQGPFDLISAFDVFEHLTRDEIFTALDLARERLKPGGQLLLQVPNGDSPFAGTIYWSDATHETNFTVVSLRHFFEAAGFRDVRFQESYPPPLGFRWRLRWLLWRMLRAGIVLCHRIETGGLCTGHYSRVIRVIARRS